ncbi:MAG: YgiQ family radical SAM protein [Oscillospiraceae bacterium]|nr:YgiQ family radical SAM protein [Oscillospiraceae bacterium]
MKNDFLPISKSDMSKRGWDELDFLYIVGDAYVDHPSFGHAIISRVLESRGYRVGISALPDWRKIDDFVKLGRPKLGVLVSAGNIDSMVNHYTASKKKRHDDSYAPGNKAGMRPDRATIVYCNRIREAFGSIPILIGGVEASLRRFAHYDYWDDKIHRSILLDSRANILMYGMGEKQIAAIADKLRDGVPVNEITDIPGTCYLSNDYDINSSVLLPSYEECLDSKRAYADSCRIQYYEQNPYIGKTLVQKHGDKYLIQNPPMPPLETDELDAVYALPYMKNYHPIYEKDGGVPAICEVKFSLAANRGCFGSCNFCALAFHQGRIVTSRSDESLIAEAKEMVKDKDFKGYIHDVGGPTANFRGPACKKQPTLGACKDRQCLFPEPCKNMEISHKKYLELLRKLRSIDGVKKVFIRSGIRFDYLINDKDDTFFYELCKYHISGQLKVAPEHISDNVLKYMGKPENGVFNKFSDKFYKINEQIGKKQYLVPYLMSSHPGSTLRDAVNLAVYLKEHNINPQQVQDFYPTPGTISTCMFYTGLDPFTMKKVYVPKTPKEKHMQRALLQFRNPENYALVYEALTKAGRTDLIGYQNRCLIRPPKGDILNEQRRNKNGKAVKGKGSFGKNKVGAEGKGRGAEKRGNKSGTRRNHRG